MYLVSLLWKRITKNRPDVVDLILNVHSLPDPTTNIGTFVEYKEATANLALVKDILVLVLCLKILRVIYGTESKNWNGIVSNFLSLFMNYIPYIFWFLFIKTLVGYKINFLTTPFTIFWANFFSLFFFSVEYSFKYVCVLMPSDICVCLWDEGYFVSSLFFYVYLLSLMSLYLILKYFSWFVCGFFLRTDVFLYLYNDHYLTPSSFFGWLYIFLDLYCCFLSF